MERDARCKLYARLYHETGDYFEYNAKVEEAIGPLHLDESYVVWESIERYVNEVSHEEN